MGAPLLICVAGLPALSRFTMTCMVGLAHFFPFYDVPLSPSPLSPRRARGGFSSLGQEAVGVVGGLAFLPEGSRWGRSPSGEGLISPPCVL